MRHLSNDEFYHYITANCKRMIYLANPPRNLAFRSQDNAEGTSMKVWGKLSGGKEYELSYDDEDFTEAFMYKEVLTKEEYDNY